jgi:probable HAF family extracellular repeat protein
MPRLRAIGNTFAILILFVGLLSSLLPTTSARSTAVSSAAVANPAQYTITDLGDLGSTNHYSEALGINNAGQVVGQSYDSSGNQRPFLYSNGQMSLLSGGNATYSYSTAWGINNSGQAAGRANSFARTYDYYTGSYSYSYYWWGYYEYYSISPSSGTTYDTRATIFDSNGPTDLGVLGYYTSSYSATGQQWYYDYYYGWHYVGPCCGSLTVTNTYGYSYAYDINDSGEVVGGSTYSNGNGNEHAFIYNPVGGMTDIGSLGGSYSTAYGINNSGHVTGYATNSNGQGRAFLWNGSGLMQDLGTLPGGNWSYGWHINDSDQVAGTANNASGYSHPFLYDSSHGMQDLGTLGGSYGEAFGVNNSGKVVGWSYTNDYYEPHAFLYDSTNGIQDLNSLLPAGSGWMLYYARDINDTGQIVGYGVHNGYGHAFLLTPSNSTTTTGIVASIPSSAYGDLVTFTASVASEGEAPADGEMVEFFDGAASLGSVPLSSGSAALNLSSLGVGEHLISASYAGNTTLEPSTSSQLSFTVTKATPIITWNNPADIVYGTALSGTHLNATASVPGVFTYTLAEGTMLNAGANQTLHADFAPTDTTNYEMAKKDVSINVNRAALTVKADDKLKTYGDATVPFTVGYTCFVNGEDPSVLAGTLAFNFTDAPTTAAGSHTITPNGLSSSNYDVTFADGTLTVNRAALTVKADDKTKTYGDAAMPFTVGYTGFVNGEDPSALAGTLAFNFADAPTTAAGSHTITPSGLSSGNYDVSFADGTLTVNRAALTVKADDKTKTYGDAAVPFTVGYTGFVNGEDPSALAGTLAFNFADAPTTAAGSHSITPSGLSSSNYDVTFADGTLTVNRAALTVKADDKVKSYGTANPTLSISYLGFVNGETAIVLNGRPSLSTTATTASSVGSYEISVGGPTSSNYDVSFMKGTLKIIKADQTIDWSYPTSIVYGTPLSAIQLNATVTVIGPAPAGMPSYAPPNGTILNAGNGQMLTVSVAGTDSYNAAAAIVSIDVAKATTALSDLSSLTIAFGTSQTTLSGKITAGALIPPGSVLITMNNGSTPITLPAAIQGDGSFAANFSTASLNVSSIPYAVSYTYPGNGNFNGVTGVGSLTVAYINTLRGLITTQCIDDEDVRHPIYSARFAGLTSGNLPGAFVALINYTPTRIGPNVLSTITNGRWAQVVTETVNGRPVLRGTIYGRVIGGSAQWNSDGTHSIVGLQLTVEGGTMRYLGVRGTGVFDNGLWDRGSLTARPPRLPGITGQLRLFF